MKSRGITLIELIIALSIFAIVVPLATGLLVSIVQNQRKVLTQQDILSQADYVIEYMSRALRTATKGTTSSCAGIGNNYIYDETQQGHSVIFTNHNITGDVCQEFHLNGNVLEEIKTDSGGNKSTNALTSSNYTVSAFDVFISPYPEPGTPPKYQPRVSIYLDIKANTGDAVPPEVKLQTTVSQRDLDI